MMRHIFYDLLLEKSNGYRQGRIVQAYEDDGVSEAVVTKASSMAIKSTAVETAFKTMCLERSIKAAGTTTVEEELCVTREAEGIKKFRHQLHGM